MKPLKIIECPRDAMQGIKPWIPTEKKANYIQALLRVGFDTIDFGSFVSAKAIPQMQDTTKVLQQLDMSKTKSKLLVIVANYQGAVDASKFSAISYLGYPFSISENFQMRNTHKTIAQSVVVLQDILALANKQNKKLVVYLSMGFGNPYGDPWSVVIVAEWVAKLVQLGVRIISISDTIGSSTPEAIHHIYSHLIPAFPEVEFGAHLHTTPTTWFEKLDAAYQAGCYRFDGAIQGFGGCPMAKEQLTGNMPTEKILSYFTANTIATNCNPLSFESAYNVASQLFQKVI